MSDLNPFYNNIMVKAKVGHKTNHGIVTEIHENGRVSTGDFSCTFAPTGLELALETQDITEYQEINHVDAQVTKSLMQGHIVRVGDEEYRFAFKNQKLYETKEEIFVAMDTGIFQRMLSYDGNDTSTPSGFIWVLFSDSFNVMQFILERMTSDEKTMAIMNLAFDNETRRKG